ncbi:LysR family transcriptional regulator [Paraburkholderia sp. 22B1P]|uniref:LysR family transcriptional regulator n=1 Tax=Paraburkholderia sp. 22B1P TaxID=3080498 RepID=UPI00309162C2|nr:LysR family transcriptional regulator [Paraburkholderia sp. 22B1P]
MSNDQPIAAPPLRVNLKLLHTFMLVAELRSFRQAADAAHRSQSAITTQIKQLEEQLGVTLFHRTTRLVKLTEEGEQLLESARRAVNEVALGLRKIQEAVDVRRGRISLSCSTTIASTRLAFILAEFEKDYPGIEVFVRELTTKDLMDSVRKDEVDFGIGAILEAPDLAFEPILTENLYALVPDKFRTESHGTITLEALSRLPLLLLNPATALRSVIEEAAFKRGLTLKQKFQFTQAQTLITMATAGLGVAVLPEVVLPSKKTAGVEALLIVDPPLERQVAIITVRGRTLSPAAARLAQLLRQLINGKPPSTHQKKQKRELITQIDQ